MNPDRPHSKLFILFLASRPKFLTASAAPVLVGSALGFAVVGSFQWHLFVLALLGTMALHSGANIANDYFDHISGNDWANRNVTPFSGGRQFIQQGILSPKATLLTSLFCLTLGAIFGVIILLITKSIFILALGLIGLLGGFFYTAPPVKLGYRGTGEAAIAFLFGILPVYGAYYLQTETFDIIPLPVGCIVGILIFLIILINEFPDVAADAAVDKKTLVVRFGIQYCVWIYRYALAASYAIAIVASFASRVMFYAGLAYLLTLPIAVIAFVFANPADLAAAGKTQHQASAVTIGLHLLGSLALMSGMIISGLMSGGT